MTNRIREIDYLRAFSACTVVLIHVVAFQTCLDCNHSGGMHIGSIFSRLIEFAVPVFASLSGYSLWFKYEKHLDISKFYARRLKKILPAYLIFSFIYECIRKPSFNIQQFLVDLVHGASYPHLYFVPIIIIFYLAFPWLRFFYLKFRHNSKLLLIAGIILSVLPYIFGSITWQTDASTHFVLWRDKQEIYRELRFIRLFTYFAIGIAVADKWSQVKKWILSKRRLLLLICFSLIFLISWLDAFCRANPPSTFKNNLEIFNGYFVVEAYSVSVLLTLFSLAYKISNHSVKSALSQISQASFAIYLVHPLIEHLIFAHLVYNTPVINSWLKYPIIYFLTLCISFLIARTWLLLVRSRFNFHLFRD